MPLKDTALVSLAEAKEYLDPVGPDQVARLQDAINHASDIIEGWCNRPLRARAFTRERVEGPCGVKLYPRLPLGGPIDLTKTIAVTVDGTAQTVWMHEADGDPATFNVMVRPDHFWRARGWRSWGSSYSSNPYNVVLTFTGGYDPIPDDLQLACFYLLQRIFGNDQQKGFTEVSSASSLGGSVGFTPRGFVMPGPAVDILTRYAIPAVG